MEPDRLTYIIRIYPKRTQLFGIILQPPLHRGSTAKVNLINPRKLCQACFYMFFRVLLNQYRRSGRINCKRHERRLAALSRALHLNIRVAHPVRQFRPRLTDNGRSLKAGDCRIHMLVQVYADTSPTVSRSGVNSPNPFHAGKHRLQFTGSRHLHHTRRSARHTETHREAGQRPRRVQFDRQQRDKRQPDQRHTDKSHNQRKGGSLRGFIYFSIHSLHYHHSYKQESSFNQLSPIEIEPV